MYLLSGFMETTKQPPNKTLQATAAVLCGWEVAWSYNAVVAAASALPAAVAELGR